MTERSTISQQVQIGLEVTPGTGVPANKLLTSLGFNPSPQLNFVEFAPPGFKYDSIVALLQEWSSSALSGYPTYTEIVYPLSSILVAATPSTSGGVSTWTFDPASGAPDEVKTFTVERGSDVQAERIVHGLVNELGLQFSRTQSGISGSMLGRAMETGITLTASPSSIGLVPILPTQIDVYLDDDAGSLGGSLIIHYISANWSIGNRFSPLWVLDSSLNSFVTIVEIKPDAKVELSVEANSDGMAILDNARDGSTKFMRIQATGPDIPATATPYSMTIDVACKVGGTGGLGDQDGVYKADYTMRIVHDNDWGQAMEVVVVNDVASL